MNKLLCLSTTRGLIVLSLDSHQKEDSDHFKLTSELLMNKNSEFIALNRGYSLTYKCNELPVLIAAPKWRCDTSANREIVCATGYPEFS